MFTVGAYQESLDEGAVAVALNPCVDDSIVNGTDLLYVPPINRLWGVHALGGTTITQAYLKSPSIDRRGGMKILPVEELLVPGDPAHAMLFPENPLALDPTESLQAYLNADPSSAEVHTVVIFLSDGELVPVKGEIFTVDFTAAITSVVAKWVNGAITLGTNLPVGRYQLVGAMAWEADLIAARFNFLGSRHRPGMPGLVDQDYNSHNIFRHGRLGVWGEFEHNQLPSLEILHAAAAAQTINGVMDLIKVV